MLKTSFAGMVSHEFRTPLGIISAATEMLERYHDRLRCRAAHPAHLLDPGRRAAHDRHDGAHPAAGGHRRRQGRGSPTSKSIWPPGCAQTLVKINWFHLPLPGSLPECNLRSGGHGRDGVFRRA
jgi:hypothetical protein